MSIEYLRSVYTLVLAVMMLGGSTAQAKTFWVSNTNDSGQGSLRQAILDANARVGKDRIRFRIDGCGPGTENGVVCTINVASSLPDIVDRIDINGSMRENRHDIPGNPSRRPGIELKGAADGPYFASGLMNLIGPGTSKSKIRGLIFNSENFFSSGLYLFNSDKTQILGNYFNVEPNGMLPAGTVAAFGLTAIGGEGYVIGGRSANNRNVALGAFDVFIFISGESNITDDIGDDVEKVKIIGNYIGFRADGTVMTEASRANAGISPVAGTGGLTQDFVIKHNKIARMGNGPFGALWIVAFQTDERPSIVEGILVEKNTIRDCGYTITIGGLQNSGPTIFPNETVKSVVIIDNEIFDNDWEADIDIGALGILNGVTANDAGDLDEGNNNQQNFPLLTAAYLDGDSVLIDGVLNSESNRFYRLDFYANSGARVQTGTPVAPGVTADLFTGGEEHLGFMIVHTDDMGDVAFSHEFELGHINSCELDNGEFAAGCLTATATLIDGHAYGEDDDDDGFERSRLVETSEFSPAVIIAD